MFEINIYFLLKAEQSSICISLNFFHFECDEIETTACQCNWEMERRKINCSRFELELLLFPSFTCSLSSFFLIIFPVVLQSVPTRTVCGTWIKTAPGTMVSTALSSHSAAVTATGATAAWTPSRWSQSGSRNAACSSSSGGDSGSSRVFNLITCLLIYSTPTDSVCVHNSRTSVQGRIYFISLKQTDTVVLHEDNNR